MHNDSRRLLLALCAGTTSTILVGAASAQTATSESSQVQVSEVVVTAQKRSENLQVVPSQVNVVGAVELDQLHVTQLTDIGAYVPGLQVNSGGAPGQTILSLRGIAPIGPSATVGVYIDDTPVGSTSVEASGARLSVDLLPYDVQRLEILQGPQGTLYGANSIGGLIKYVLTTPDLKQYHARAGFDVFGVSNAGDPGGGGRVMITGPIVEDKLGFIASYSTELTPGYIDNAQTGQTDQNSIRQQGGRLALLWRPTTSISVQIGALLQKTDANNDATVALSPTTLHPVAGELTDNNYIAGVSRATLQHYSAEINWDLRWAKLVSATSYSMTTNAILEDKTRVYGVLFPLVRQPAGLANFTLDYVTKKVTQEIRLSSEPVSRLDWLVGAFYTHESTKNEQTSMGTSFSGVPVPGINPLLFASLPDTYNEYAVFGDLTYHLTDRLDVGGGLRYSHNDQNFNVTARGFLTGPASLAGSSSEDVVTYNFNPRYRITKDVMTYLRIASGYQAGGPNIPYPGVPPIVKSDTLTNYEVGLKSEFWGKRALLNVAAFYIDWNNIQVLARQAGTGFNYLNNGGTAKSEGVSVDGSLQPMAGLTLAGNVTYSDSVLTQDIAGAVGRNGDRLPYIPRWSGSLQANYSRNLTQDIVGHVGGGVRLVGDRVSQFSSSVTSYRLGAYDAFDLNADLTYRQYTVRLFVKNLGDTRAYDFYNSVASALTGKDVEVEGTIIQPRTIGISVDAKF